MEETKPLPILQGRTLAEVFLNSFPDEELAYFRYVDIDELFLYLIGGDNELDIFRLLEESGKEDVNSYINLIDFSSFLEVVLQKAEELEFYEMCHNTKVLLDKSLETLKKIDEFYTQNSGDLSRCND